MSTTPLIVTEVIDIQMGHAKEKISRREPARVAAVIN